MNRRRGWRPRLLAREAVKNVFGVHNRLLPYAVSALLAGCLTAIALTAQWINFTTSIDDLQSKGRGVFVAEASSQERPVSVERTSCEKLTDLPTVSRAGFIVNLGRKTVSPLGEDVLTLAVSTSLVPELRGGKALVGSALSSNGFSGHVEMGGNVVSAAPGQPAPAGIDVNSAVSIPLPVTTTSSSQCVIEMDWRATSQDVSTAIASLHVSGGNVTAVPAHRESTSAVAAFLERPERWLPLLVGVLGGLATSLAVRSRRGELAAYLFGGASPRALAMLIAFECALIGGIAATSGCLTMLLLSPFTAAPTAGMLAALAMGSVWVAAALPLSVPMAMVSPVELGKGR